MVRCGVGNRIVVAGESEVNEKSFAFIYSFTYLSIHLVSQ